MPAIIAICSSPDCTGSATAPLPEGLPETCAGCGAPMLAACWKCAAAIPESGTTYCVGCGVPLKRVLPRQATAALIVICESPDCDWGAAGVSTGARPTRCPACGSDVSTECWKCSARITDRTQLYCARCGVPLKRDHRSSAARASHAFTV